jgi:hypothetical protein
LGVFGVRVQRALEVLFGGHFFPLPFGFFVTPFAALAITLPRGGRHLTRPTVFTNGI